jgi:cell division protein FtsB
MHSSRLGEALASRTQQLAVARREIAALKREIAALRSERDGAGVR